MKYSVSVNGEQFEVEVKEEKNSGGAKAFKVDVAGSEYDIEVKTEGGAKRAVPVFSVANVPAAPAMPSSPSKNDTTNGGSAPAVAGINIEAPMAGKVVAVNVKQGDRVSQGDTLFILEAMKMENSISCTATGTVAEVLVAVGDIMQKGSVMCVIGQ